MKNGESYFVCMSSLFSSIVLIFAYYTLFADVTGEKEFFLVFIWAAAFLILYLCNEFFYKRGMPVNFFIGMNTGAFFLFMIAGFLFFARGKGILTFGFMMLAIGATIVNQFLVVQEGIKPNQMLVYTEFSAFTFVICLAFHRTYLLNQLILAAFFFNFISLILLRLLGKDEVQAVGNRKQGIFALVMMVMALGVLVFLFSFVFSHGMQQAAAWGVGQVLTLFKGAGGILIKIISFLFSLFPEQKGEAIRMPEALPEMAKEPIQEYELDLSGLYGVIGFFFVVLVAVLFLLILRKGKGRRIAAERKEEKKKRGFSVSVSFWERWRETIKNWKKNWFLFCFCVRNPNSVQAFYLKAETYGKRKGMVKEKGETGEHFLNRLKETTGSDPKMVEALQELSDNYNILFFSQKIPEMKKETTLQLKKLFRQRERGL